MSLNLPSARHCKQAALFVSGFAAALLVVGCAQWPVRADAGPLVSKALSGNELLGIHGKREGLCFSRGGFCIGPFPIPLRQAPLLDRETEIQRPADKAERLPVSKICLFVYDDKPSDSTIKVKEVCVPVYHEPAGSAEKR